MHLVIIGGSDAEISAALRARELDSSVEISLLLAVCVLAGRTPTDVRGMRPANDFCVDRNTVPRLEHCSHAHGGSVRSSAVELAADVGGPAHAPTTKLEVSQ